MSDRDYGGVVTYQVNKFGQNPACNTTPQDIWDGEGVWAAPTEARIHAIVSSAPADASGGTGAQTIRIYGLKTWDSIETNELITMPVDGTTPVNTVNSYVIIHRMKVLTWGSGKTNAGTITATAATDGTVTAQILAGKNQTLMAVYGVPSIIEASVVSYYHSVNKAQSASVNCALLVNYTPEVTNSGFLLTHIVAVKDAVQQHKFRPPITFSGPAIIKLEATGSSATDTDVSGGFDIAMRLK